MYEEGVQLKWRIVAYTGILKKSIEYVGEYKFYAYY